MKTYSIKYRIIASFLVIAFTFQSMKSINNHTYTIGVNSFHVDYSCMMRIPTHLAIHCSYYNCNM